MAMAQQTKLKVNKVLRFIDSKKIKCLISFLFITVIAINVFSVVLSHKNLYFSTDYWKRFPKLEKLYLNSQYVNKHPIWQRDEVIQAYAGGAFIKGINPVYVLPDTPPLGKYLIGVSTVVFNNENIIILFSATLSLFLLFILGSQIFSSKLLALVPPLLFSFEPIFKNQLIYTPLLDLFQLVFLLLSFIAFNKALSSKKSFVFLLLANVFVGMYIATKFFITGVVIEAAFYFVLLVKKDIRKLLELTLTFPIAVFILLLSYIRVFAFGYTINKFLGIQKWVFLYHKSLLILPLSIWPLMLLNKWYVWYGNKPVVADSQWIITWPFITLLTFVTTLLGVLRKIKLNKNLWVLISWVILYFVFFSFGEISSRYFVILIPVLYIIAFFGIVEISKRIFLLYYRKLKKLL
jgi:4-amino-4-deoxy-L-arabinose transferase-like glycosyltransferase